MNWAAVNFGAQIENASFFDYYIKGIGGGFDAYYTILPVHEKIREYAGSESRDIRFFPLKVSDSEYARLIDTLSNRLGKPQPYKFFTYNCADGIYDLLSATLDSLPKSPQKIMAPQDLILILQKQNRLEYPYLFPSLKERVLSSNSKETARLEFLEWENMQKNAERDSIREKELASLRLFVSKNENERRDLLKREKSFVKPHGFSRLDVGTQFMEREANAFIRFRPLLHDPSDNSSYYSAYSTLELLAFGLTVNEKEAKLRELNLVHIRSAPVHDYLFKSWSWDIFTGYKNDYTALNTGFGKSVYINKRQKLVLEFLLLNSARCRGDFGCDNFIGLETHLNKRSTGNFRYGANFEYLRSAMDFERKSTHFKTWFSYDLNKNLNLYAENVFGIKKQELLGLYLRFYP